MNQIIRTGFQPIICNITFDPAKIKKGKDLSKVHIRRVEELNGLATCKLIRCSCIRTYKVTKKPYGVKVDLDGSRLVTHTSCTCVSGKAGKCKHIYGLIHRVNTDRSETKTSFEQEWDKPSDAQLGKEIYAKPLVLAEKYKPNDNFAHVEPYKVTLEDLNDIDCPLRSVLKVESMKREELLAKAEAKALLAKSALEQKIKDLRECVMMLLEISPRQDDLHWCNLTSIEPSLKEYFESNINFTNHEIFQVCIDTIDQSTNSLWYDVRKKRISASSRAHKIKTMTRKTSNDLAKDFLKSDANVKSTAAQEYGTKNEKKAVREYQERHKKVVRHVGVYIMPLQSWLCGSPDGIVMEGDKISKILEIKCPFTCKSKPIFDTDTGKFNVGYLTVENGITCLKKSHQYYSQCQVLMYITGLTDCDLYVWSPKGSELVVVKRDEKYLETVMPKIEEFYFNSFLPILHESDKENETNNSNQ